jgi:PAS domain S-box-containing protein
MLTRVLTRASATPEPWQLHLDVHEAERRKHERVVRLNTVTVPRLRVLGYGLVSLTVLLHNHFAFGAIDWPAWLRLNAALGIYCALSWYILHLFYADLKKYIDLGLVFLVTDLWFDGLAIYASGAEQSWLFFLAVFRVVDQTPTSMRRALVFAHLAPLSYLGVVVHAIWIDGRSIPLAPELAKLTVIYTGSLYTAMVAKSADRRTRRMTQVIRLARQLVTEREQRSAALEASSRELRASLEAQKRLTADKAVLYTSAQQERTRQQQIFDSTSDGIVFVGRDGRVQSANLRAGELIGFDPLGVVGSELARLVSRLYSVGAGDSFLSTLQMLIDDPWAGGQGDLQQPATGRILHWHAQPARDMQGDISGLTFTFQDVTRSRDLVRQLEDKTRLLEEAGERSEAANRAKGEFLANVSREFRTPLGTILSLAEQMEDAPLPDDRVQRIHAAAESLLLIVNDILDFSKVESRTLSLDCVPFSLRDCMRDAADALRVHAWAKHLEMDVEVAEGTPDALLGDPVRLRQVLMNLLDNAVKFTDRGEVRLSVGVATLLPDEVCLHFGVRDTGIGIPRDKQDVVFEAFAQTDGAAERRVGGTGLGLSISRRLVAMMGGDLWVESEAGAGATFRFTATFTLAGAQAVEDPVAAPLLPLPAPRR